MNNKLHYLQAFEADDVMNNETHNEEKLLRIWRKRGPVGKLHNITTYITRSPQHRIAFKKLQDTASPKMII